MRITRTSLITGVERSIEIPITQDHVDKWENGTPIDEAMSHLSPSEREFILTGITDDEWDKHVAREEQREHLDPMQQYDHLANQHCASQICERDRNFILGPNRDPHPCDRVSDHGTIHGLPQHHQHTKDPLPESPPPSPSRQKSIYPKLKPTERNRSEKDLG